MLHTTLNLIHQIANFESADAHCDIPCKIYDPASAIIAALSVVRLMDIMQETSEKAGDNDLARQNTIARCVMRKEEEAEKVKHEIRIIWGDYFKTPQFEAHPSIHDVTHNIMLTASRCKQEVNRDDALKLVELVNEFAAIFWNTKGMEIERKTCPYPPSLEVVRAAL